MIQQIVARRDLREHLANFFGRVCLTDSAFETCSLHWRGSLTHRDLSLPSLAAAIKRGVKCRTRSTARTGTLSYVRAWPMRGERTKRRMPLRDFLSERMALSSAGLETFGQGGKLPRR